MDQTRLGSNCYDIIDYFASLILRSAGSKYPICVRPNRLSAATTNYGDHGSAFVGGPLVCHAALAVLDKIKNPTFLASVTRKGLFEITTIKKWETIYQHVKEVRGFGLIVGIELDVQASPLVNAY
ncbi:acetylornithine aminotransferase, mitochondrial [Canna indica]|uniref:Acetylornithine aminotransferase, mitochondrial n=1 Tax=Canna indica TaxID=4628 RepID=A0AAQ3K599_9LILI|nr:acetylornithine aminotransferase, mitochondrial [Canna indica]